MKKILQIILSIFILTSCSKTQEVINNENEEETIIYINNYDQVEYQPVSEYKESVEPNNSWNSEGNGSYSNENGCKHITVNEGSFSLYSNNVTIRSGLNTISFDINSDVDISINLTISSTSMYLNKMLDVKKGDNNFEFSFNASNVDYKTVIRFDINGKCNLGINNLFLSFSNKQYDTRINQVGYLSNLEKEVVFNYNPGDYFGVYKAEDDSLIYVGTISSPVYDNDSEDTVYKGFFKDVIEEGEYYIKSEFGEYTYDFYIGNNVYDDLSSSVLHFLYVQRCGSDIVDKYNNLSHPACHTNESKIWSYTDEEYLDTTGGWHDAGDYGKYLYTTNQTIADLLISILYGESDDALLEEARYGLEFIMKLQRNSGSVYNKVTSKEFSKFVSPEYDTQEQFVLYKWTSSTASFAGCMGLAYEVFKDIDEEFSNKCLESFNKAINYLYDNQSASNEHNPDGFNVGTYYLDDEIDERLFAYAVAYKISNDTKYLILINNLLDETAQNSYYRVFSYVTLLDTLNEENELYTRIYDELENMCNSISDEILSNGYPYPSSDFQNSNGTCARAVTRLLLGARYLKDERYLVRASEAINYLLGQNTLDLCFVYEYGYKSPHSIHSRLAISHGQTTIKGALASGVVQNLTENILKNNFSEDTPLAKRWIDNYESYGNVEPSINNNSSLVLALSLLKYANNNKLQ